MMKDSSFAKLLKLCALIGCLLCTLFVIAYHYFPVDWLLTLTITIGTTEFHLVMRLAVGFIISGIFKDRLNPDNLWFRPKKFERKLYRILRVRRWKAKMPTYAPGEFSIEDNTPEQIIQNSCVAEMVHECIMLASFLPLLASLRWGAFPVFLITSILAATFDSCFVMMQRYNRPRFQQYVKYRMFHKTTNRRQRS